MKVPPRCLSDDLGKLKTQEGIGLLAELIPLLVVTDCCPDQSLGDAVSQAGIIHFGGWQAKVKKHHEGTSAR
jgi:hypothetical protein